MQPIKNVLTLLLFTTSLLLPAFNPPAHAGPIPATQMEFPQTFIYSAGSFGVSSNAATTETNVFQATIPGRSLGNNGILGITVLASSPDAAAVAHTYKVYLGGTGTASPPAGSTAIATNSYGADLAALLYVQANLANSANTLWITGNTTTNSFGTFPGIVTKTFGTGTNFLLTITASAAQATNVMTLNSVVVDITSLQ